MLCRRTSHDGSRVLCGTSHLSFFSTLQVNPETQSRDTVHTGTSPTITRCLPHTLPLLRVQAEAKETSIDSIADTDNPVPLIGVSMVVISVGFLGCGLHARDRRGKQRRRLIRRELFMKFGQLVSDQPRFNEPRTAVSRTASSSASWSPSKPTKGGKADSGESQLPQDKPEIVVPLVHSREARGQAVTAALAKAATEQGRDEYVVPFVYIQPLLAHSVSLLCVLLQLWCRVDCSGACLIGCGVAKASLVQVSCQVPCWVRLNAQEAPPVVCTAGNEL